MDTVGHIPGSMPFSAHQFGRHAVNGNIAVDVRQWKILNKNERSGRQTCVRARYEISRDLRNWDVLINWRECVGASICNSECGVRSLVVWRGIAAAVGGTAGAQA